MLILFWYWLLSTAFIIGGFLGVSVSSGIQRFIANLFVYGKSRSLDEYGVKKTTSMQVPKRWFRHMYIAGVIVTSTLLIITLNCYVWTGKWPQWVRIILQLLGNPGKPTEQIEAFPVLLALALEECQVIRRCLETHLINVYSDSKMSWAIYGVGLVFYSMIGWTVLSLAPETLLTWDDLLGQIKWYHGMVVMMFIYFSWKQFKLNWIMAKLRKDKHGNIDNTQHHIPMGDLFEWCSCPHFLMEVLVYLCLASVFAWQHSVCNLLAVFVLINQVVEAHINHTWYLEQFPKYPKSRTAIFPYIFSLPESKDAQPHLIRCVTWNINGLDATFQDRCPHVLSVLDKCKAHIIYLQEVSTQGLRDLRNHFPEFNIISPWDLDNYSTILVRKECSEIHEQFVIPFNKSLDHQGLNVVACDVKGIRLQLITTHTGTGDLSQGDKQHHLQRAFNFIKHTPMNRTVIFGGSLNVSDKEMQEFGSLPDNMYDVWELLGRKPETGFTWNSDVLDSKSPNHHQDIPQRSDRLYVCPSHGEGTVVPKSMKLIGQQKMANGLFPSTHYGVLVNFTVDKKKKVKTD